MYKLVTAPSVEPVSVSELKSQLRITTTSQDTMLGVILNAARQYVEDYLRFSLITATWELYLDSFPKSGDCIWIQKSPVTDIVTLTYTDTAGANQTLTEGTDFTADYNSYPCRVYEAYSKTWPGTRTIKNAVTINFKAGYADAAHVPEKYKIPILMLASSLYENPSDEVTGTQVNQIAKNSVSLMRTLRAMRF